MAEKVTMNPVGWFEIYVDNMERAKQFYETVLEKPLSPSAIQIMIVTSRK